MPKQNITGEKKKKRGREGVNRYIVIKSAQNYRRLLRTAWPKLSGLLLPAQSPDDVTKAFQEGAKIMNVNVLVPRLAPFIFDIIRDDRFPRARAKAQIKFLADSLGADSVVTARRSREICAEERAVVRHIIVRREFYVECTCGYQGPALDGACRKCGATEMASVFAEGDDDYEQL
jgi:hypothetical protein